MPSRQERAGTHYRGSQPGMQSTGVASAPRVLCLAQDSDHHAAILRPAFSRLVRRDRVVFAVTDRAHPVEGDLVGAMQVALDGLGPFQPEPLVHQRFARRIGVSFDLDKDVAG